MATKRIETQLTIKAVDQYSGMLKNMRHVTGRFADGVRTEMGRLQSMRGPLKLIEDFRRQQQVVARSGESLEQARERVRQLKHAITSTRNPTAQMRREFDRARASAESLDKKHRQNRRTLHGLQSQMRQAGVNTGDLAGEQRRLAGALDTATTAFGRQMERMRRLETMQTRIADARARMDRSLATAANLSFVGNASMQTGRRLLTGLSGPIREAVEFESAMSDVRKVVDFDTPAAFAQMSEDILELSTRIPMAAEGLAQIVAAGGQSGIAREDLTRFAEMAAKIGVAFDISADHAGTSMASIKTALGLTLDETGSLFDAMNHLSNNSAARADQTLEFINRAGASGATFGFSTTETLAIGAAMIAAGAGADTAATSFRNMGRALTRGESATKRQAEAMQRLGLDSVQVARDMQRDAVGTTAEVLQRLRDLPEHLQASVMSDLFGDEARELTKLINNAELLPQLLSMVAEERQFLGSAEAEYAARAATTANNLQLMRNQMARLGVSIGEVVLPPLNDLLDMSQGVIDRVVAWTKEHPKLTKWLVIGTAAMGAMAVAGGFLLTAAAGLIGTMAVMRFGLSALGARAVFAAADLIGVGGAFRRLRGLPKFALSKLIVPLTWAASLLPPIPWGRRAGKLKWSSLIKPLVWAGRGALRFIPVIGWAALAGSLVWHSIIKPLGWDKYLPSIDWKEVIGAFEWDGWVPKVDWSQILEAISWPDWIPDIDWARWFSFTWRAILPVWSWAELIPKVDLSNWIKWPSPPEWWTSLTGGQGRPENPTGRNNARATGGPVETGLPYLVNEHTPRSEWFIPSRSGGILNVSQAKSVFRSHLSAFAGRPAQRSSGLSQLHRGAQGLRAASIAALASSVIGAPAAAEGGAQKRGPGAVSISIGSVSITVPEGVTDPQAIAELTANLLGDRVAATLSSSYSD